MLNPWWWVYRWMWILSPTQIINSCKFRLELLNLKSHRYLTCGTHANSGYYGGKKDPISMFQRIHTQLLQKLTVCLSNTCVLQAGYFIVLIMNFIIQNDILALNNLPFNLPNMLTTLKICKRQTFFFFIGITDFYLTGVLSTKNKPSYSQIHKVPLYKYTINECYVPPWQSLFWNQCLHTSDFTCICGGYNGKQSLQPWWQVSGMRGKKQAPLCGNQNMYVCCI